MNHNPTCAIGDQTPLQASVFSLPTDIQVVLSKLTGLTDKLILAYHKQQPLLNEQPHLGLNIVINWITSLFHYSWAPVPYSVPVLSSKVPILSPNVDYLPTLSPLLPPTFQFSLNSHSHLKLMSPLFNIHSLQFKIITGIFALSIFGIIVLCIFSLTIKLIEFISKILKNFNFYIKRCNGEHSAKWKDYMSNNPIPDDHKFGWWVEEGRSGWGRKVRVHIRRNGSDRDRDGNGPNNRRNLDKPSLDLINKLEPILIAARIGYTHHGYINHHAYRIDNGNEINPRRMQEYRSLGYFEHYGIHDRARYPNVADCPYVLTTQDDWYQLYIRTLHLIWTINPEYVTSPLPTDNFMDTNWRNYEMYITFPKAAYKLGLPLVDEEE